VQVLANWAKRTVPHVTLPKVTVMPYKPDSCRNEFAGGAPLILVHSNEKVLDNLGEEHIRSESNRASSARAN